MRSLGLAPLGLILAMALTGCVSANFPLCPKLAAQSYQGAQPNTVISSYLWTQAKERRIKISPTSAFTAELSGSAKSLAWFRQNYAAMLCSFDDQQITNDESVYSVCMKHAQEWVRIVQSDHPENLMLQETLYAATCVK
jgi:hypothetical protein